MVENQLLSEALDEKETEMHRDAYGAKNGYLLNFSWLLSCLVFLCLCTEMVCLLATRQGICMNLDHKFIIF